MDGLLAVTGADRLSVPPKGGRRLFVCCRVCSQTPYRSVAICLGVGIGCLRGDAPFGFGSHSLVHV